MSAFEGRLPVLVAVGASIGVIGAYLIAGGAAYKPLEAADPCDPRPLTVLTERGVLEGLVLSGLDGAACDLGVSREELTLAFADDAALAAFSERYGVSPQQVENAVRAGLLRAADDAEREGMLPGPAAAAARVAIESAPIGPLLDAFRAIPGQPSLPELLELLRDLDIGFDQLEGLLGELGEAAGSGAAQLQEEFQRLLEELDGSADTDLDERLDQFDRLREDLGLP
jgi:hypothetical protein